MVLGMQIPIPLIVCLTLEQDEIHVERLLSVLQSLTGLNIACERKDSLDVEYYLVLKTHPIGLRYPF